MAIMKTLIFYFSATGNSLKVARDLANKLEDAQIISISQAISDDCIYPDAQCIGIVYPVYMWGMPLLVADFIERLNTNKGAYIFSIATFGGMSGSALKYTGKKLSLKGMELSAGFLVQMPGNYTPLYGAIPEEKQKEMFKKAEEKIKLIAEIVKEKKKSQIEASFFMANWIFSSTLYKIFAPKIPMMDGSFWIDEKCNSCGICAKVCPVGNIEIVDGKPVWLHKCEQCLACLQWCPQEAIQFKKSTVGRKRYCHPEAKVEDFML